MQAWKTLGAVAYDASDPQGVSACSAVCRTHTSCQAFSPLPSAGACLLHAWSPFDADFSATAAAALNASTTCLLVEGKRLMRGSPAAAPVLPRAYRSKSYSIHTHSLAGYAQAAAVCASAGARLAAPADGLELRALAGMLAPLMPSRLPAAPGAQPLSAPRAAAAPPMRRPPQLGAHGAALTARWRPASR